MSLRLPVRFVTAFLRVLIVASTVAWAAPVSAQVDTTPPVIVSTELLQTSVVAGQSFKVRARVTDNSSGVARVCATLRWADNRAGSGVFGCSTELTSGTRLDGIYEITISVPHSAASGELRGSRVTAVDASANSAFIEAPVIGWSLMVTGGPPDTAPPSVASADLLQTSVTAGQSFTLRVRATDAGFGVRQVCATFTWADGRTGTGVGTCVQPPIGSVPPRDAIWDLNIHVDNAAVSGTLRASSISATDDANQVTTVLAPNAPVGGLSIAVSGGPDMAPPTIVSASLTPTTVLAGSTFAVRVVATDDLSGVRQVCVGFEWADGRAAPGPGNNCTTAPSQDGAWRLIVLAPQSSGVGLLRASYISATDNSGKITTINAPTSPVGDLSITVTGVVSCTPRPPVSVTSARLGSGQLQVTAQATGGNNTIKTISFGQIRNATVVAQPSISGAIATFVIQRSAAGAVTVPFTVTDGCGEWKTFVGGGAGSI
jgi:hypothetical protein